MSSQHFEGDSQMLDLDALDAEDGDELGPPVGFAVMNEAPGEPCQNSSAPSLPALPTACSVTRIKTRRRSLWRATATCRRKSAERGRARQRTRVAKEQTTVARARPHYLLRRQRRRSEAGRFADTDRSPERKKQWVYCHNEARVPV